MGTIALFSDLRTRVENALRIVAEASAPQAVIQIGIDACEVDWAPDVEFDETLLLPLLLITAAIDEGAARSRWQGVRLTNAVSSASKLDGIGKAALLALAKDERRRNITAGEAIDNFGFASNFSHELLGWVDRFDLARDIVTVEDVARNYGDVGAHYGVNPVADMTDLRPLLQGSTRERSIASIVLLTLYDRRQASSVFNSRRNLNLNPPALDALSQLRAAAGFDAEVALLRLLATYRGW